MQLTEQEWFLRNKIAAEHSEPPADESAEPESEELSFAALESLMGALDDGYVLTDKNGVIRYMNKAAEKIFAYTFVQGRATNFDEICQFINIETKEKFYCPIKRVLKEKKSFGLSKNIGIMHGTEPMYLSATCSPRYSSQGELIGTSSIFRDITRLRGLAHKRESDQYYMRSVFEAAKIGICSLNIRGEVMEVNETALETLGATYNGAIGLALGDIFKCINCQPYGCGHGEKCKFCIIRNNIAAAVLDDSYSSEFVAAVISQHTERPVWLQIFLTQVWKENEKQIVLTMIDISQRRQREKELTEARRMAEVASNTKTQFLANMSHEIRTPINGMTGMINLTLRSNLTDDQRSNLQAAKQCSEDLLCIINDILDYAKLENGKMTIEKIDLDLHALLQRVVTVHSQVAVNKGLEFVPPDYSRLPQFVTGDPLRLRQILHNLLTNALKFTLQGKVILSCRVIKRGIKELLEFSVEDTGIGMTAEAQEKLFKPFSQVDGSTTRKFGGTGLGLMIVKELVTAMNGEIHVLSRAGEGSKFTFTIPLLLAEKADLELKEQAVFVNPYWEKKKQQEQDAPEEEPEETKQQVQIPQLPAEGEQPDEDILDLLKYCEDKLNN